jgi:hypothetical protein
MADKAYYIIYDIAQSNPVEIDSHFRGMYCLHQHGQRVSEVSNQKGRAIAQAVSRRLPTAAARVQTRVWSCGILWWTKVTLGQVFSENFGFSCQSTFRLLLHNHLHYHPRLAQQAKSGRSANSLTTPPPQKKVTRNKQSSEDHGLLFCLTAMCRENFYSLRKTQTGGPGCLYFSLAASMWWTISKNSSLTRISSYYSLFTVTLSIVDIHVF